MYELKTFLMITLIKHWAGLKIGVLKHSRRFFSSSLVDHLIVTDAIAESQEDLSELLLRCNANQNILLVSPSELPLQ